MKKILFVAIAVAMLVLGVSIGRWTARDTNDAQNKIPLYYRHPMGLPDTSPVPKKDEMGMDYIAVYANEKKDNERKILFYRNPMGLSDTSPVPKKDSMGMDYIPAYEDEAVTANVVRIAPEKIQKLGVRTERVQARVIQRPVRAVGTIEANERKLATIAPRFEGWIENLYVNETGQSVVRDQVLFSVYSPEIVAAQQEYLLAFESHQLSRNSLSQELLITARSRLLNWQLSENDIRELESRGHVNRVTDFRAINDGVVLEKMATQGMRFMPGEVLYRLADLRTVWLIANVYEQDLASLKLKQPATLKVEAYPGEVFNGLVTFIYPVISDETRTARVRIELPNPKLRLRPGMYGQVDIKPFDAIDALPSISDSALMDSGKRQLVLVKVSDGLFEPREVIAGQRGDGFVEVRSGVAINEEVVVSANFLIDAESNLKAAIGSFGHSGHGNKPASDTTNETSKPSSPTEEHKGH